MKFDKWLKQKHLEIRVNSWICERKLLPMSPNPESIDQVEINENTTNEVDILIINENIENKRKENKHKLKENLSL